MQRAQLIEQRKREIAHLGAVDRLVVVDTRQVLHAEAAHIRKKRRGLAAQGLFVKQTLAQALAADGDLGESADLHQLLQDHSAGQNQVGAVATEAWHLLALAQGHSTEYIDHLVQAPAAKGVAMDAIERVAAGLLIDL